MGVGQASKGETKAASAGRGEEAKSRDQGRGRAPGLASRGFLYHGK